MPMVVTSGQTLRARSSFTMKTPSSVRCPRRVWTSVIFQIEDLAARFDSFGVGIRKKNSTSFGERLMPINKNRNININILLIEGLILKYRGRQVVRN